MSDIQKLFKKSESLHYPNTMLKVAGKIKGRAFFPGGTGLLDGSEKVSDKDFMMLGQDFDCEKNYSFSLGKQEENNATWRNLLAFLEENKISSENCFYTNVIMGIRKGDKGTGKSLAFKDPAFIKQCQDFFLYQIELQQPKAIFVLGKFVAEFLSETSESLKDWNRIKSFSFIDEQGKQVLFDITFNNGVKSNLILLTHPSFRNSNVFRRSYNGFTGHEAEKMMVLDVLKKI